MSLSQKSLNFARKILKHNPNIDNNNSESCNQEHKHQNCSHKTEQPIKPYLHVHDHRKEREIYQKPTQQKLENMKTFKEEGNEHFKNQKYQEAAHYYNKVIIFADYTFPDNDKQQKLMDELLQQANCNLGITLIKLNQSKKSKDKFTETIKGPSQKLVKKGYYWLVKCNIEEGNFDKAKQSLQKMKTFLQDTSKQVEQLEHELKKAQTKYQTESKCVFAQMF